MWHPMYTWHCEVQNFQEQGVCPNGAQIALWDPITDATAGGSGTPGIEGKLIERITGDLYFKPIFPGLNVGPAFDALAGQNTLLRIGLMKQRAEVKETYTEVFVTWNPLDGVADPTSALAEGDWTQGRWLRQWEHHFASQAVLQQNFYPASCCPNVTGTMTIDGTSPGATTGSGSTATDCSQYCNPETPGEEGCQINPPAICGFGVGPFFTTQVNAVHWWHLHVDVRTKLRMENTDRLDLWLGWYEGHGIGTNPVQQPNLLVKGSLRGLW